MKGPAPAGPFACWVSVSSAEIGNGAPGALLGLLGHHPNSEAYPAVCGRVGFSYAPLLAPLSARVPRFLRSLRDAALRHGERCKDAAPPQIRRGRIGPLPLSATKCPRLLMLPW